MGCGHNPADFYAHRCDEVAAGSPIGIHALVIGTSTYEYPHKRKSDYDKFADIPGAALSAGKFAKFLKEGYHDPAGREIVTIRVLLSPADDEEKELKNLGVTWLPATRSGVDETLKEWFYECDQSADNVTIFYAAGHGLNRAGSHSHVFLKAEGDEPSPFYYSLNVDVIKEALLYNRSQTITLITDCCAEYYYKPTHENGILLEPKYDRGYIDREYDPLHIVAACVGASTYALGATEGTMLSYVLERLLASAGEVIHHPDRRMGQYFAITQDAMSEQVELVFLEHPKAKLVGNSCPRIKGQTVAAGLHRPKPPPKFRVEFVIMDTREVNPVDITITTLSGDVVEATTISPGRVLELKLPAGIYVRKSRANEVEINVDRPKRFDVLSRDFDLL